MNLMLGPYSKRRKLALEGKMYLAPIAVLAATTVAISYLSSSAFDAVSGSELVRRVSAYGIGHVPAISKAVALSPDPEKCSFVMTIQWSLFLLYAVMLFVGYYPLAPTIRVAIRNHVELKPVSNSFLRVMAFLAFAVAFVLGDFSVVGFPTFFNGDMITADSSHSVWSMSHLIADGGTMPLISWFSVFASAFIYWALFYVLANFKLLVDQGD